MYPNSFLPKPLNATELYILLALAQSPSHTYALIARVFDYSLGSVTISDKKLYNLIKKLEEQALIEQIGEKPSGKSNKLRMHYAISEHARIRLQEELTRLNHIVKIGRNTGLMDNHIPTDLQRLVGNPVP